MIGIDGSVLVELTAVVEKDLCGGLGAIGNENVYTDEDGNMPEGSSRYTELEGEITYSIRGQTRLLGYFDYQCASIWHSTILNYRFSTSLLRRASG